jgi:hypothetical protein
MAGVFPAGTFGFIIASRFRATGTATGALFAAVGKTEADKQHNEED